MSAPAPSSNAGDFTSADLWQMVKPLARQIRSEEGLLILDDSVEEKPNTDEGELVCRHLDQTIGWSVKGINLLTYLYNAQNISLSVAFELVRVCCG